MKVGLFSVLFSYLTWEEALDKIKEFGIEAVEVGTGNYPNNAHCKPDELLKDASARSKFKKAAEDRDIMISALSCQGNPLNPNKELAKKHHDTWRSTVELASELEIPVVCHFSGCPGDSPKAERPNWVTCAWPNEYSQTLKWQWEEVAIPYWQKEAEFARSKGIKIAFEMHPGFLVYNPRTLLRLREAAGDNIGANFDPSHLIWQGINPAEAIRYLGKTIYHFHAKDTYLDHSNIAKNGVLDTASYTDLTERSWTFRSVGYGLDEKAWRDMVTALRLVGYDYALSIEHEDPIASVEEGLKKSADFLNSIILKEPPANAWWI
ncbi:MAG: sugar phosphate isomerase/epimerase [Firmicutes bacterium]|nr:sugar phosphate isomerase/epimerase [Bacillota bacterium]MDD4264307.1 sugar phosphate isomerase/epimerase [Bacillota bacterium]MDD4694472.1 sugar phosphate isomerase/epimerase [Bacillota bacterium]